MCTTWEIPKGTLRAISALIPASTALAPEWEPAATNNRRKRGGVLTSTSRPPAQDGLHLSLFRFREGSYEVLNRLEHDSPLRFGLQHAEHFEFTFHLRRNPNTQLRVIRHLLAGTSAGRRPSAAAALSSISLCHPGLQWRGRSRQAEALGVRHTTDHGRPRVHSESSSTVCNGRRFECRQKSYGSDEACRIALRFMILIDRRPRSSFG